MLMSRPHPPRATAAPGPFPAAQAPVRAGGLAKVYRDGTVAADDIDLSVTRGEVFGLLGPNGAGKSTTVGMLTTAIVPTGGRAWVEGVDVAARPALARLRIGVVPQRNTLDRRLTVRDNLVFHGRYFGMPAGVARREADALLDRFALGHVARKTVQVLSGGMAQRLMIARAIMHGPSVVFLDEPTAGLDPQSRLAVHDIVRALRDEGRTVLLITHDMDEADRLSDRVAIIDHGRILALGTPAALKGAAHDGTEVTVVADGDPDVAAALLRAEVPGALDAHVLGSSVMLTVAAGDGDVPAVVAAAGRAGLTLRDVRVGEPTLETIFISLTGKELRDQ
jgi:ABC-2 type transport system ATP-binding protein